MQYLFFSFWLTSLCMTVSKFIHITSTDSIMFFFVAESYTCCLVAKLCPTLLWLRGLKPTRLLLSRGFPRQGHWSGWPFPSPGDLLNPGIEPGFPALAGRFFTTEPPGKPEKWTTKYQTQQVGSCCVTLWGQLSALWWPGQWDGEGEGGSKWEAIYDTNSWFTLLYSRNQHNTVKQLYFKKQNNYPSFLFSENFIAPLLPFTCVL